MQTVTIDTHEAIEALRAKKFTKEQAKAIVDTICSVELYGVATSDDIRRLEEKITQQGIDLSERINSFRAEIFKWGGSLIGGIYALMIGMMLKLAGAF